MQPIRKILVALDHSTLDSELVDYAHFFVSISEVTDVHFMHEVKINLSANMKKEFPDLEKEALENRKSEIEEVIKQHFNPKREVNSSFTITNEGNSIKPLLRAIKKEGIDMIMVGSKDLKLGGGTFTHRLARRSPCHVLTVPIGSSYQLKSTSIVKKFLVPIDFSHHSKQALERAILIASRVKGPVEILCQNVYTVPSGYHYSGKSREEFADLMKKFAIENFEEFIKDMDTKNVTLKPIYSYDIDEDKTSDIRALAKQENVVGIIMGSRGKTAAALLLGSMAEKLIRDEKHFPILVVRKKGDFESIIDRIRKL
jgi:nucleotide-binding universal stress UspA family protein